MWFSPDGSKLAFYRFDETPVPDFYLTMNNKNVQDSLDVEAYPKAGVKNPIVGLLVYDLATKKTTTVDTSFSSDGGPGMGEYVYSVNWSPDGKELLFNRSNRHQNVMEFCAANPSSGACRVIIKETQRTWTDNAPDIQYLDEDKAGPKRFLWMSERNGFYNLYLYDLSGKLYNAVTKNEFEVSSVVKVDKEKGLVYYMSRDGANPYLLQFHRVHLDGTGDTRLTDPAFNHSIGLAPDGKTFLDTEETIDTPPVTNLVGLDGKVIDTIAKSDTTKYDQLGLKKVERFTFTSNDGTLCYGSIFKPSDFDPNKQYPVVLSVYGGPDSGGAVDRFALPTAMTEMGFLIVNVENRGTRGRGKEFKDKIYGKLGIVEIDDFASAVNELAKRPYVDAKRVGIYGTSYGGYSSVMAILRHPEAFHAASGSSPVTDWLNYDSVYTERYEGLPWDGENKDGYKAGAAATYAGNLTGRLMLYYGTADNNVHPTNTFQLIEALGAAGKSYDLQVGVDRGHTAMNQARMWEFFVDYLINDRNPVPMQTHWNRRSRQRRAARQ
jgi:dipeptidyl-peptidase-4